MCVRVSENPVREAMMINRVLIVLAVAVSLTLAGCNTMEGFGKDLSTLGNEIEKKADEKK
jgi:predicted small secreted protein